MLTLHIILRRWEAHAISTGGMQYLQLPYAEAPLLWRSLMPPSIFSASVPVSVVRLLDAHMHFRNSPPAPMIAEMTLSHSPHS